MRTDHGVRADDGALADVRARMDDGRGMDVGAVRHERDEQLGFGSDFIAHIRHRPRGRQRTAPPAERDLEPQTIAGRDPPAQLHVVDAAEVDARVRLGVFAMQQQHGRQL